MLLQVISVLHSTTKTVYQTVLTSFHVIYKQSDRFSNYPCTCDRRVD